MGKVKDIFNRLIEPTETTIPYAYSAGFQTMSNSTMGAAAMAKNMSIPARNVWSLNKYKNSVETSNEAG